LSKEDKIVKDSIDDYDVALATKYIAANAEQTGLDLSRVHGLS
jgi:hypothetical protein